MKGGAVVVHGEENCLAPPHNSNTQNKNDIPPPKQNSSSSKSSKESQKNDVSSSEDIVADCCRELERSCKKFEESINKIETKLNELEKEVKRNSTNKSSNYNQLGESKFDKIKNLFEELEELREPEEIEFTSKRDSIKKLKELASEKAEPSSRANGRCDDTGKIKEKHLQRHELSTKKNRKEDKQERAQRTAEECPLYELAEKEECICCIRNYAKTISELCKLVDSLKILSKTQSAERKKEPKKKKIFLLSLSDHKESLEKSISDISKINDEIKGQEKKKTVTQNITIKSIESNTDQQNKYIAEPKKKLDDFFANLCLLDFVGYSSFSPKQISKACECQKQFLSEIKEVFEKINNSFVDENTYGNKALISSKHNVNEYDHFNKMISDWDLSLPETSIQTQTIRLCETVKKIENLFDFREIGFCDTRKV